MPLLITITVAVVCCVVANRVTHKLLDLIGTKEEGDFRKLIVILFMPAAFLRG